LRFAKRRGVLLKIFALKGVETAFSANLRPGVKKTFKFYAKKAIPLRLILRLYKRKEI
jgi:hypothetical protein